MQFGGGGGLENGFSGKKIAVWVDKVFRSKYDASVPKIGFLAKGTVVGSKLVVGEKKQRVHYFGVEIVFALKIGVRVGKMMFFFICL